MLSGKQSRDLSPSHEHYLRAIWEVRSRRGYARLTDVARALDVALATLSVGLRPLEKRGLVAHDEARFLVLTSAGERLAREVHHRHEVLRRFLSGVLHVPAEIAEHEACLIEHDISDTTTERLVDLLKLLDEDADLQRLFQDRLKRYHRNCDATSDCSTCGLACLTSPPQ